MWHSTRNFAKRKVYFQHKRLNLYCVREYLSTVLILLSFTVWTLKWGCDWLKCVALLVKGTSTLANTLIQLAHAAESLLKSDSGSTIQQILRLIWNSEVHCRVHKSLPLISILNHIVHPLHNFISCCFKINFNIIIPSTPIIFKWSLQFRVLYQNVCATCSTQLILLDFIIVISGDKYKVWSSSLCIFLQPSIIFSLLGLNILSHTLLSLSLIYVSPPGRERAQGSYTS
jgi:hypothetical protein